MTLCFKYLPSGSGSETFKQIIRHSELAVESPTELRWKLLPPTCQSNKSSDPGIIDRILNFHLITVYLMELYKTRWSCPCNKVQFDEIAVAS